MSRSMKRVLLWIAILSLSGSWGTANAGPLDPAAFASLGAFPTGNGVGQPTNNFFIDTGTIPFIFGAGISGVSYTDPATGKPIAVFDFDTINLTAGQTFTVFGPEPVAFLRAGNITIAGTIDSSGDAAGNGNPGPGAVSAATASGQFSGGGGGGLAAPGREWPVRIP